MFAVDYFAADFFPPDFYESIVVEFEDPGPSGLRIQGVAGYSLHSIPGMRYTNAIPPYVRMAIPDRIANSSQVIGYMDLLHSIPYSDRTDKGEV